MEHSLIQPGEMHPVHNWEVTSEAALNTLTVTYTDVGKLALVQGNGYFRLVSASPLVWAAVDNEPTGLSYANSELQLALKNGTLRSVLLTPAVIGAQPVLQSAGASPTTKFLRGDLAWWVPTKADVDLGNVDNTSDANKPVSTAQAAADSAVLTAAQSYAGSAASSAASSAQSYAVQRSNHTGTQTASTISDFNSVAAAAAPVQSVNSATGNVTVNAATGATYNVTTGVLTLSKNNGQASDTLNLPARDWTVYAAGTTYTLASGAQVIALTTPGYGTTFNLPAGSNGYNVTIRVASTTVAVGECIVHPAGSDTINGVSGDMTPTVAGTYYFRYFNSTWNYTFAPLSAPGAWYTLDTRTSYPLVPNTNYQAYNSSLVLPPSGLVDGDTIQIKSWIRSGKVGQVIVSSGGTRYIRERTTSSGTNLTLQLDSTVWANQGCYIFTWNAGDSCWYYHKTPASATFTTSEFRIAPSSGIVGWAFSGSTTGLTERTISLPDADLDFTTYTAAKIASLPKYNTSSSNTAPVGTDAAIVAGSSNVVLNERVCVTSGKSITSSRLARGIVARGNQDTSISPDTKTTVFETTYKTRVASTGSGPYSAIAYPTENGSNSLIGDVITHMPAALGDHVPFNAYAIGVHEVVIFATTDEATKKAFYGKRRVGYCYDGTTYTQIAVETVGTDQDPQGLAPTISFSVSNGYLMLTFSTSSMSAAGKLLSVHADIRSVFNGD